MSAALGAALSATLAAVACAAIAIRANYLGPKWHIYLGKPLATILILLIALLVPAPRSPLYQFTISLGLALSLLGDVFLMLPSDRFLAGLISFLLAHVSYAVAFAGAGWATVSVVWLIGYVLIGLGMLRVLGPGLGRLRWAVVVYLCAILLMAWLATGVSGVAALGGALFVVSDGTLAYEKFVRPFAHARWLVLSTYWAAQWLIAFSVWA